LTLATPIEDVTMTRRLAAVLAPLAPLLLAACASMSAPSGPETAPQPAYAVDEARFFTGRWYEIARTPMKLTDGCVAGTTDYLRDDAGRLIDKDACRKGTPEGHEKAFTGSVTFLNPEKTKMRVDYKVLGLFSAPRTWWILDHDETYGWFVVSDPQFQNVSLFSRNARPSASELAMLNGKAKALGYDVSKLEYPAQFTAGQ
jgi:apolipoprotein D and lipocalin family protein